MSEEIDTLTEYNSNHTFNDERRIKEYVESVKSVKERFDTSVMEAIVVVKVPEDIRDDVKKIVYEYYD